MILKVLLVGSGITSALISAFLKVKIKNEFHLVVWEKAKGIGGRMSTSTSPSNNKCKADLGAQYITSVPTNETKHKEVYDSLMDVGLLQILTGHIEGMKLPPQGTVHYVVPNGMKSVVKHFFNVDEIKYGFHVTAVKKHDNKIEVKTDSGIIELFDVVILTQPVPQILNLGEWVQNILAFNTELKNNLMSVKYSSRYALGLFYDEHISFKVPWIAKYLYDDSIFRYIGLDDKKRNVTNAPSAVVFHTSTLFGEETINDDIDAVQAQLVTHVKNLYPSWPKPSSIKCQKWKFSQVIEPYTGRPGFVTLMEHPLLIAGGDSFTTSNFDGCISSAIHVSESVTAYINQFLTDHSIK